MNSYKPYIHHVSAIVGNPQVNLDFYAFVLGMRFVKQTVNFDDPGTYHFYFGQYHGQPGTLLTFFPWSDAYPGSVGSGQVSTISLIVPPRSFEFWTKRIEALGIQTSILKRFGEQYLTFKDPHGLNLELVERGQGQRTQYETEEVTREIAIKGIAGVILNSAFYLKTGSFLENFFQYKYIGIDGNYMRYQTDTELGNTIDLYTPNLQPGTYGVGTIHHLAFSTRDDELQKNHRDSLLQEGFQLTPILDRKYFKSIYFREHGSILFEIATEGPGFQVDEPIENLGELLQLPYALQGQRREIVKMLKPIVLRPHGGKKT
jgi:glyoxalase family protein